MDGRYNTRSPAVKRLMREAQELSEPTDQYFAQPLDDNLFEWHFTVRGPADSDFQNGIYHGRIILPVDYPMKPPSIIWLTPNGRFETHKKICLSISGHHPESWQPSWSIRTALLAIIGFMPTHPGGAIGSLDYTPEERKVMAKKSKDWQCPTCGDITGILLEVSANSEGTSKEARELAAQINLQGEKPKCKDGECPVEQARLTEIQSSTTASVTTAQADDNIVSEPLKTTNSNNATNITSSIGQQGAQQIHPIQTPTTVTSSSAPVFTPQMPFPQWPPCANLFPPMMPMGFPYVQYPSMPPMQFPYPPSHYSAFPQCNWPIPPDMSMFPPSFTPPPIVSSSPVISTNNSSTDSQSGKIAMDKTGQSSLQTYTRTAMTCSVSSPGSNANRNEPKLETSDVQVKEEVQDEKKGDVLKELLSKVKRIGSDATMGLPTTTNGQEVGETVAGASSENQEEIQEASAKPGGECDDHECDHFKSRDGGGTNSDISQSLKKGDRSVSEAGDTNTEDNSESGVPPIEGNEPDLSVLDKCACSSTSELEKWKQRYQASKGLRQRQSATASVPTELSEEAAESDRSEVSTVGQRIEAASGDTALRNRPRQGLTRFGNNTNGPIVQNDVVGIDRRTHDFPFYLMLVLLASSVMILFNRLVMTYWY